MKSRARVTFSKSIKYMKASIKPKFSSSVITERVQVGVNLLCSSHEIVINKNIIYFNSFFSVPN